MKKLNRENTGLEKRSPIKVVQFGTGNFLRAFTAYAIQRLNDEVGFNAGIAVVQSVGLNQAEKINEQDGLFTLFLNGVEKGKEIQEKKLISSIVKAVSPQIDFEEYLELAKEPELEFIFSNTTESGIEYVASDTFEMRPPSSFPAKLTVLLYERYKYFKGDPSKGVMIIPCELINHNAAVLKEIIVRYCEDWKLEAGFKTWLLKNNSFHNTLVDRIVPGFPKEDIRDYNAQLDYLDSLIVVSETFFLWVIEGDDTLKEKLPFHKINLDVKMVSDMQPYRTCKVRILNGAHTAMVPYSIMCGHQTVKESVDDDFSGKFIKEGIFKEIIETIDMDKEELSRFAEAVLDRFRNPFIKHLLSSIALNSISKFKVRVLPSLLEYAIIKEEIPVHLTFAFACLIRFYKGTWQGNLLPVNDSKEIVDAFSKIWESDNTSQVVQKTLENTDFWNFDLTTIAGLSERLVLALDEIEANGIEKGFVNFTKQL